jgi:hypothetical protein
LETRRITVQIQSGQIVPETLSQKNLSQKRADRVAQGVGPEFKPQYCKIIIIRAYIEPKHRRQHSCKKTGIPMLIAK